MRHPRRSPETDARMAELHEQCAKHIAEWEATLTEPRDGVSDYYARKREQRNFWCARLTEARAANAAPDLIAALERAEDFASYVGD